MHLVTLASWGCVDPRYVKFKNSWIVIGSNLGIQIYISPPKTYITYTPTPRDFQVVQGLGFVWVWSPAAWRWKYMKISPRFSPTEKSCVSLPFFWITFGISGSWDLVVRFVMKREITAAWEWQRFFWEANLVQMTTVYIYVDFVPSNMEPRAKLLCKYNHPNVPPLLSSHQLEFQGWFF